MSDQMIVADSSIDYQVKEAAVIVAALGFVLALGGVVIAAWILCGWRGAKSVSVEWLKGKATFSCR